MAGERSGHLLLAPAPALSVVLPPGRGSHPAGKAPPEEPGALSSILPPCALSSRLATGILLHRGRGEAARGARFSCQSLGSTGSCWDLLGAAGSCSSLPTMAALPRLLWVSSAVLVVWGRCSFPCHPRVRLRILCFFPGGCSLPVPLFPAGFL